jgi:hypothetical protein
MEAHFSTLISGDCTDGSTNIYPLRPDGRRNFEKLVRFEIPQLPELGVDGHDSEDSSSSLELLSKPLFVYDKEDVCGHGHDSMR